MARRTTFGAALTLAGLLAAALPAAAQDFAFRIQQPDQLRIVSGTCTVRWTDIPADSLADVPTTITWYYSTHADGSDRKRMVTTWRDNFDGNLYGNWRPGGPSALDWAIKREPREKFQYLSAERGAGPCSSRFETRGDVVVSVKVRPQGVRNDFSLSVRAQQNSSGYTVQNDGSVVRLLDPEGQKLAEKPLGLVAPRSWYWYEIGIRTVKRQVELRVRVFDKEHERALVSLEGQQRQGVRALLQGGGITLQGPADFAEVYIDPWESRWVDDCTDQMKWDVSSLQDGQYYLVAELSDGKAPARPVVSPFKIEVQNPGRAADTASAGN